MTEFPDEATVTAWEAAAHEVRLARRVTLASVADGFTAEADAAMAALTDLVAEVVGRKPAEDAVTHWLLTDRPISDVAWWHRLGPGVRVHERFGSREGVVRAPDGEAEVLAEMLDVDFMRRHVSWSDAEPGTAPELVRTVQLAVADDTP